MRFIMFRDQWIEPILRGTKVQTVRPPRKVPLIIDQHISLRVWSGKPYASKQKTLLDTRVTSVVDVVIDDGGIVIVGDTTPMPRRWTHGGRLTMENCERFAKRDGFESFEAMQQFFREMHGLPFTGTAISWD